MARFVIPRPRAARHAALVILALLMVASPGFSQSVDPRIAQPQSADYLRPGIDYGGPVFANEGANLSAQPQSDIPPGVIVEIKHPPRQANEQLDVPPVKEILIPPPSKVYEIGLDGKLNETSASLPVRVFSTISKWLSPIAAWAQTVTNKFDGGIAAVGVVPADAAGAVGPNRVVSALNGQYYFLNRSGTGFFESTNTFWCTNGNFVVNGCPRTLNNPGTAPLINFDSKVLYDSQAQRWVISSLGGTQAQLQSGSHMPFWYLGISNSSDPTGTWNLYWFQGCGNYTNNSAYIGDQPKLGLSDKWIVVQDSACGPGPLYNLSVLDKAKMYAGPSSIFIGVNTFPIFNQDEHAVPAYTVATPSPSGSEYLVSSTITTSNHAGLILSYIYGATDTPNLFLASASLVNTNYTASNELPEMPTPSCINCNNSCTCLGSGADDRLQSATVQFLKNGHYALLVGWEFGITNGSGSLIGEALPILTFDLSQGTVLTNILSTAGAGYLYPSFAMANSTSNGNLGVWQIDGSGYNGAFSWVWMINLDTSNVLLMYTKYGAVANPLSSHWGDYTTVVPDPADGTKVWSLGSKLNSNGTQDQWWTESAP